MLAIEKLNYENKYGRSYYYWDQRPFRRSFFLGMEVSILLELCSAIFISQGRNMIRLYYCAKDNELQIFFEGGDLLLSEVI
jgi:hypothetical protein